MSSKDKSKAAMSKEATLTNELASILDDKNLTDIELETDALSIRVSRTPATQTVVAGAAPAPMAPAAPAAPAPAASAAPADDAPAQNDFASHPGAVKSPMVGTYYESAEPGAPAFIAVGDKVTKGQTLCIIEAMKVMNTISAPAAGTVKHIACSNATPVEFDQLLVVVE